MYLLYVDESGDPGIAAGSPSDYFFLAGLLVDARHWQRLTAEILLFRQDLAHRYALPVSEEIHASVFISNRTALAARISANDRLRILLECLEWCAASPYLRLLATGLDKRQRQPGSAFAEVWEAMYRLFDDALAALATPAPGLVLCDNTDGTRLNRLVQSLQPPAPAALRFVVEAPIFRESHRSYLHQLVDVVAYFAKQQLAPNKFVRDKGAAHYFARLAPINLLPNSLYPEGVRML